MPPPANEGEIFPYYPADAVSAVLLANCSSCHGPDAPLEGSGGIRFIGDVPQLIAAGLLVPLNSLASPVVRVMLDGTMPPPDAGLPPLTDADINTVTQYLDNPRYWPDVPTAPGEPPSAPIDAGAHPPASDAGAAEGG
jgi:mono/diheme cytochrome c family protein